MTNHLNMKRTLGLHRDDAGINGGTEKSMDTIMLFRV